VEYGKAGPARHRYLEGLAGELTELRHQLAIMEG
jgi:hypothetical protein